MQATQPLHSSYTAIVPDLKGNVVDLWVADSHRSPPVFAHCRVDQHWLMLLATTLDTVNQIDARSIDMPALGATRWAASYGNVETDDDVARVFPYFIQFHGTGLDTHNGDAFKTEDVVVETLFEEIEQAVADGSLRVKVVQPPFAAVQIDAAIAQAAAPSQ